MLKLLNISSLPEKDNNNFVQTMFKSRKSVR